MVDRVTDLGGAPVPASDRENDRSIDFVAQSELTALSMGYVSDPSAIALFSDRSLKGAAAGLTLLRLLRSALERIASR